MRKIQLRLLSYFVMLYMLLALGWWSYLLFDKTQEVYETQSSMLMLQLAAEQHANGVESVRYADLIGQRNDVESERERQQWMILGETLVFIGILFVGLYLIDRGYRKEVEVTRQRRNFLLSISHELKSPIASIKLILETFQRRALRPEQIEKFSGGALRETERLEKLVTDLLFSAKLEEAFEPHNVKIDIKELSKNLVDDLRMKYPQAHFSTTLQGDNFEIEGDTSGITSVLLNLLENAVKYSKEEPVVQLHLQAEKEHIEVSIEDNGIGIPERERTQIFEKFYRIGNEDTRSTKGTGLGLYIVNEIVKAHRGKISIEDNLPQGTRFNIQLPVHAK